MLTRCDLSVEVSPYSCLAQWHSIHLNTHSVSCSHEFITVNIKTSLIRIDRKLF